MNYRTIVRGSTIRPMTPDGDDYFGLTTGTNGTAAIARRALVKTDGLTWVKSNGKPAVGIYLAGSGFAPTATYWGPTQNNGVDLSPPDHSDEINAWVDGLYEHTKRDPNPCKIKDFTP